jgi:hypothetical protein
MEDARRLCEDLPQILDLLDAGQLSERHARVVVDAVVGLNPAEAALVQAAVVGKAPGSDGAAVAPGGAAGGAELQPFVAAT